MAQQHPLPHRWHWTYDGPHGQEHRAEGCPARGGRAQSPIDMETRWAQPDPSLPPLRVQGAPGAGAAWPTHPPAESFADAGNAQLHASGLAVLAVLLEAGAEPNAACDNILRHLGSVRYAAP
ncbi:carbonic anhydrase 14 [Rhea pennata]|uniref:carbonic anhydrase 14 n=1 Tax=Rhea pennata TaxID=8795 RepID=UPI002E25A854